MTLASPDLKLNALTRLAARRTGLALQRTRLAEDRTLMAVMRTALALISFGFAIDKAFERAPWGRVAAGAAGERHFGLALIAFGVVLLLAAIVFHIRYIAGLRRLRNSMRADGLVYGETVFPMSPTLVTACLLLVVSLAAIVGVAFQVDPFG